jgi:hypothetical protein
LRGGRRRRRRRRRRRCEGGGRWGRGRQTFVVLRNWTRRTEQYFIEPLNWHLL